jgi:hypothetical protein
VGINLTDAELSRITPAAKGFLTFGDASQTGDITFKTVSTAAAGGAPIAAVQNPSGAGRIVLDADAAGTPAPALARPAFSPSVVAVSLSTGHGGIVTTGPTDGTAEIATIGAVALTTTGSIGSPAARLQFDAVATPSRLDVSAQPPPNGGVYLDGLAMLTLGGIDARNGTLDVTSAAH